MAAEPGRVQQGCSPVSTREGRKRGRQKSQQELGQGKKTFGCGLVGTGKRSWSLFLDVLGTSLGPLRRVT